MMILDLSLGIYMAYIHVVIIYGSTWTYKNKLESIHKISINVDFHLAFTPTIRILIWSLPQHQHIDYIQTLSKSTIWPKIFPYSWKASAKTWRYDK